MHKKDATPTRSPPSTMAPILPPPSPPTIIQKDKGTHVFHLDDIALTHAPYHNAIALTPSSCNSQSQ